MDATIFLEIGIVGVALSLFIQLIKVKLGTDSLGTKLVTVGLAVALGSAFYFLQGTGILEAAAAILGTATVFYAFFLK